MFLRASHNEKAYVSNVVVIGIDLGLCCLGQPERRFLFNGEWLYATEMPIDLYRDYLAILEAGKDGYEQGNAVYG